MAEKEPFLSCSNNTSSPGAPSSTQSTGNPVCIAEGTKWQVEVDFTTGGVNALSFIRYYNSDGRAQTSVFPMPLGVHWQSNFDIYLSAPNASTRKLFHPDGSLLTFTLVGSVWTPPAPIPVKLEEVAGTWEFTDTADTVHVFDGDLRLVAIRTRNGYEQTLAYGAEGRLETVTDSYGRTLAFGFAGKRLTSLTIPDGGTYGYVYDRTGGQPYMDINRLVEVHHPSDVLPEERPKTVYHYEDPELVGYLTGITDERGVRFATWAYNPDGRTTLSEHAGGAGRVTIAYNPDGSRTVTGPLGQQTIYRYTKIAGVLRLTSLERQATANVPAAIETRTYDANGFIEQRTDFEGNVTTYVHDARGLQTSRTEAVGTPEERTITTTWHPSFRLQDVVTEPGRTTDFDYDAQGRMTSVTVTDTTGHTVPYSTNGETRTWTYTYNASGQVLTVDGPRSDVTDVTTFAYDARGNRDKVINALGQTTHVTAFNGRGLPLTLVDPNNVETELGYNPRGWLIERRVKHPSGDAATTFDYDAAGQVTTITQPDGTRLHYEYDDARRLTAVRNDLGERIDYVLDAMGNRTAETVKSATGTIKRTQTRVFDELGRLLRSIGAASQTWVYAYDDNDNLETVTDPATGETLRAFDALDRLIQVTDPALGEAGYAYDARDNLTAVTDQRMLTTTYVHNAFGDVIQRDSPDTGVTVYLVDPAGNVTQMTDARGVITDFTYDALHRPLTRTFPADAAQNVGYGYDDTTGGNHGVGRLTSMTDRSGSAAYRYDHRGNLVEEARTLGAATFTTGYAYDLADNVVKVTYPSGRIVNYDRDDLGRVAGVTTQESAAAVPVTIADDVTYLPFGPMESLTFGNGLTVTYGYDQDYRLTDIDTGGGVAAVQDLTLGYDGRDNITAITDNLDPARDQGFGYDALSRLTSASGPYGDIAYTYDPVGNRETRDVTVGAVTTSEAYSYALDSNRLLSVDVGGTLRSVTHGASGNIVADDRGADPDLTFDYDLDDRLVQVNRGGLPLKQYVHNGAGERVVKQAPGGFDPEYFHYDQAGRLLAESDGTGAWPRSYVYLNGLLIAQVEPGGGAGTPIDVILDNGAAGTAPSGTWTASTAGQGYEGADHLVRPAPPEGVDGGILIDNSDPGFSTVGVWDVMTAGSGFEGADYVSRDAASGAIGGEVIIDNDDPSVSVIGPWEVRTGGTDHYGADFLFHPPGLLPPAAQIIDNDDVAFSASDSWTVNVPSGGGHYGANQALIDPGLPPPVVALVDNTDADFETFGQWFTSTYGSSHEGSNFVVHEGDLPPIEMVTDNSDRNVSSSGEWPTGGNVSGHWGTNFYINDAGTGADVFTWHPNIPESGEYEVYARWTAGNSRATNAPYTVHHAAGCTTVRVNQKSGGGKFHLLGVFTLAPGANHRIELSDDSDGWVVADSVMIVRSREVIDNTDPNVSSVGTWSTSTWSSFWGENFYTNEPGTGAEVFTWTPDVPLAGNYKVFARWTPASMNRATDAPYTIHHADGSTTVRVDQTAGGGWVLLGTFAFAPGANHRIELSDDANNRVLADAVAVIPDDAAPNMAIWHLSIPQAGDYPLYARWTADPNRATNATYTVYRAGGPATVVKNQEQAGGQWNLLGTFTLDPTHDPRVVLSDAGADGRVQADAILVADSKGNTAAWTPSIAAAGDYHIYAWWRGDPGRATNAPYTVHHAGGSSTVLVNQRLNGSQWNLLGRFPMAPGSGHRVELSDDSIDGRVMADAVAFVPVDAEPSQAIWNLAAPVRDRYQVYAWWVGHSTRASDATYSVAHEAGETAVVVDQKTNGGKWNLLGSFDLAAGGGEVGLAGDADGGVSADALRIVGQSRTAPRPAIWSFQVASSEAYEVYAKWPDAVGQAYDAVYTVHHAGGATRVVGRQSQGGGRWSRLGTFDFTAGAAHSVELSDQGGGLVVADAIYVVPAARTDTYSWAPSLPSAGDYAVYAKWVADAGRASDAVYGIYHAGGLAEVAQDQRAGAGQWRYLGTWAFDPAGSPLVVLAGGSDGALSADAIRFVGAGPAPADLRFVHNDHLGTPQKLTDNTGTLVWDRTQTPFGLDHSVTGPAATPVRFPGQYADGESGLHYNYFRDYDPSLGRYVQSDPIGLLDGLNTYSYVSANPVIFADTYGLAKKKYKKPSNPNQRKGAENRQPDGQRERNVGHPDAEEHSRNPSRRGRNNRPVVPRGFPLLIIPLGALCQDITFWLALEECKSFPVPSSLRSPCGQAGPGWA